MGRFHENAVYLEGRTLKMKNGLGVALMSGKSYLSIDGCTMGVAGSIVDQNFFEDYLGICFDAFDLTVYIVAYVMKYVTRVFFSLSFPQCINRT